MLGTTPIYSHRQFGFGLLAILGVIVIFLGLFAATFASGPASFVVYPIAFVAVGLLVVGALFCTLNVEVDSTAIGLSFGPGILKRTISLGDVESVARERVPGWALVFGLRMSLDGKKQMWRASGSDVIRVELDDDRLVLIGTGQPDQLERAIRSAMPRG